MPKKKTTILKSKRGGVKKHKGAKTKGGKTRPLKYCPQCKSYHYKSVHKMHGAGSYKASRSKKNIAKAKRKRR